ncbi:hypothetical protein KNE206_36800 [Kitasatospora sp. NE20-6]|uniref:hypothetical protein n=1 Tax=Kitasatospora sp. NE20-6 TaxID=2859066 RepID=UPI0034DBF12A
MKVRHPAESGGKGRSRFGHLAEAVSNFTGSPAFNVLCVLLVGAFVVVHLVPVPLAWQIFVGETMSAVALLLLSLLTNSERRAEHALQRKLDAIAAAMLEQQEGRPGPAHEALRDAIGLEKRQ